MPEVEKSAACYTDTMVKEITSSGVKCEKDGNEIFIEADSIVCALGFISPYDEVDQFDGVVEDTFVIGDCRKVGKIYDAVNTGYYTALRV